MSTPNNINSWLTENREIAIELLRMYLGLGLFLKGVQFVLNKDLAHDYMNMLSFDAFEFLSIHIIIIIHIAGGILLAIGLITRIAALINIPILFGAVFFVHMQQGLFTKGQTLEFVILVLFLLFVFAVYGGGRLSVDYFLENKNKD